MALSTLAGNQDRRKIIGTGFHGESLAIYNGIPRDWHYGKLLALTSEENRESDWRTLMTGESLRISE